MKQTGKTVETYGHRTRLMVLGIIVAGGLAPLILYWLFWGRIPSVTPIPAKELLRMTNSSAILVDVRSSDEFDSSHIDGAQNWPLTEILATHSKSEVPEQFRDKTLLLISNVGVAGRSATKHLVSTALEKVMNVRGGIQEWIGSVAGPKGDVFDRWKTASGDIFEFPFRQSPRYEQLLTVINGFVIKPIHMVLSLALVLVLWRSRSADLAALRRGITFLFVGENCCAINYLFFNHTSYFFEYLHSFGMLLCFGFVTYAVLEGMDRRILMLSDPERKCAALSLCKECVKYANIPCGLKRTFFLIIPASIILAFLPLCADYHDTSYNTVIFGTFYNYSYALVRQQFEILYCPIAAIAMLVISLLILFLRKENPLPPAKIAFAAGIGPLGFGTLRMILTSTYSHNLMWSDFWEEATELLLVAGVCVVLWIFRHRLFRMVRA